MSLKQARHAQEELNCKRGDIFYCNLGVNEKPMQCGIRPVVIIQNDIGDRRSSTTIVAPITTNTGMEALPTRISIQIEDTNCLILLEQLSTINKHQLGHRIGEVDVKHPHIEKALRISVGLTN